MSSPLPVQFRCFKAIITQSTLFSRTKIMNTDRIQSTLQTLFQDQTRWPHPHRRLIFWYDPEGQFQDTFNELELPAIEKFTLGDTPFTAKHQLLIQQPDRDFLLYAPFPEPAPLDNWLLDLQKSGLTFSADRAALLYADFGFTLRHLETVLRQHLKFFDHKKRSESLHAMQLSSDTTEFGLQLALLSVLAGLKVPDPTLLIRKVLMAGLQETDNPLWQGIQKFVSTQAFWQVVKDLIGLNAPKPSLEKLAHQLLITHLDTALRGPLPQNLESLVIAPGQRAYAFIDQWMRYQQDVSAWQNLSREIGEDLKIFNQLEPLSADSLQDAATFEAIDLVLIRQCVAELNAQAGDLKRWHSLIQTRKTLVWFPGYETTYDALEAAIALVELKRRYTVGFRQSAPQIFKAYATDLYQFDLAYRHFIFASDQANPILREQGLIQTIEDIYTNWFLDKLGEAWSDSLGQDWQLEGIPSQTEFFRKNVTPILQRNDREKVFVLISDALRYEVASELAELIEKELRGDIDLKPQFGVLPSITRLGMAALLPGKTLELIPGVDNVLRDGLNTQGVEARAQVLNKNSGVEATVLSASDLLAMTSEKGREAIKPYRLIYIYHDVIDGIGDKPAVERLGLVACDIAIQELLRLVKRLCNSLNATHVLITADHGFLYQRAEIDKLKLSKADDFLESGRRMVLRTETDPIEHTLAFKLPYESRGAIAVVPRGTLRFALQGRGAQFVHGGASLQEVCVPIITYRHKRAEKGDDGPARKVGVQVNARTRRVTNNRFSLNLMQTDAVEGRWRSRRVSVGLYDSSGQAITDIKVVEFNSSSLQPTEREYRQSLTIAQSHPPTNAYLIVKDDDDDTELVREDWTISLSIINDFGDF
jgi:uncharacterized protein (TIGR02687 family)